MTAAKGANLLLNIGPRPEQPWGVTTQKGNTLYLHLFGDGEITLPMPQGSAGSKGNKVLSVRLLDNAHSSDCKPAMKCSKDSIAISVPADILKKSPDTVIAIDFKRPL